MDDSARIFVGWDEREAQAYRVCVDSMRKHASKPLFVYPLKLAELRRRGLYLRAHERREGQLWDVVSERPMSTEFALTRFLVPYLADHRGWALFCDCDFLFRADVAELFALAEQRYAVMVVKHHYLPPSVKMDNQVNVSYARKNWSSLMLFNCEHPANLILTPGYVSSVHRDVLHGFRWLQDEHIGSLPFEWNWLDLKPKAVHFTEGCPDMPGRESTAFADEWNGYR